MKRAFIASIMAITISLLLLTIWAAITSASIEFERAITSSVPLMYANSFFDDAGSDINTIIGPNATLVKYNQAILFSVHENLPKSNFSNLLSTYNSFLQNNITNSAHANVSLNFSNATNGILAVTLFDNYQYLLNYTNSSANEILFQGLGDSSKTNVTAYNVSVTVSKTRQSVSTFSFNGGDMSVQFIYSDYNGTVMQTGNLSSTSTNTFSIKYANNETVDVVIGKSGNREGIISIKDNLASPQIDLNVSLPLQNPEKKQSMVYGIFMNYSQGKIFKNAMVEK